MNSSVPDINLNFAVDRRLSTAIHITSSESVTGEPWVSFKLEDPVHIKQVLYWYIFYTDAFNSYVHCLTSKDAFRDCVLTDGNIRVTVRCGDKDVGECDAVVLSQGLSQSQQFYPLTCGYYGDEILFHKSDGNIRISEIVILPKGLNFKFHPLHLGRY